MTVAAPLVSFGPTVFHIKQGDTVPVYDYTLFDVNRKMVPIGGAASVSFVYRLRDADPSTAVARVATIVDAFNGQVRYNWIVADTAVAGDYFGEWRVTFLSGDIRTFPTNGFALHTVDAKLD